MLQHLLKPAEVRIPQPVASGYCRKQTDGWSCGYFTATWAEQYYRESIGEGVRTVPIDLRKMTEQANLLVKTLKAYKAKRDAESGSAATAAPITDTIAVDAEPPPPIATVKPILQDETGYGCSRCRWSDRGCLSCSAAKALRWAKRPDAATTSDSAAGEPAVAAEDKTELASEAV